MERLLFVVEDTFAIEGRGLVLVPGVNECEEVSPGDLVELRRQDASPIQTNISSIELLFGERGHRPVVLVPAVQKSEVPIGAEVWLLKGE